MAAYAACAWLFVFATLSFYWALGGGFLSTTQSPQILALAAEPWFITVVWLTGLLKVLAGFALSLVRRWGATFPVCPRATWHLILWDPWFLLGGVLFLAAAWRYDPGVPAGR